MKTLRGQAIACSTAYAFGQDFAQLVGCFELLGFSAHCALLWAHFGATNFEQCASVCAGQVDTLNEPPPLCALEECLACGQNIVPAFTALGGMGNSAWNAGFNDAIAHPCARFTRVVDHDPCSGADATPEPPAPTPAAEVAPTTPTSGASRSWIAVGSLSFFSLSSSLIVVVVVAAASAVYCY
jgi:hypothetical protein